MGKGSGLAVLGLLIGLGGLGFGVYIFITFGAQIDTLNEEIADLEGDGDIECDSGRILETQKVETSGNNDIDGTDTTKTQITDMNISITTHGESYLAMRFFGDLYLYINCYGSTPINGWCEFNVSLEFNDMSVNFAIISYFYEESPDPNDSVLITFTIPIYLEYITAPLSAGTNDIKVMWMCEYNSFNAVELFVDSAVPCTLIVQEIAHCQLFAPIGP